MRHIFPAAVLSAIFCCSLAAQGERVLAGSEILVRTSQTIDARHPSDGRFYLGTVDRDVRDRNGRIAVPRGSEVELVMRNASHSEIVLDVESIKVNGRRYDVDTPAEAVTGDSSRKPGVGANERTGKYVGGGAVIGAIIGAIAGGGKGAAIGAASGAGAGAVGQTVTKGGSVRLPAESLITFRLERDLVVRRR